MLHEFRNKARERTVAVSLCPPPSNRHQESNTEICFVYTEKQTKQCRAEKMPRKANGWGPSDCLFASNVVTFSDQFFSQEKKVGIPVQLPVQREQHGWDSHDMRAWDPVPACRVAHRGATQPCSLPGRVSEPWCGKKEPQQSLWAERCSWQFRETRWQASLRHHAVEERAAQKGPRDMGKVPPEDSANHWREPTGEESSPSQGRAAGRPEGVAGARPGQSDSSRPCDWFILWQSPRELIILTNKTRNTIQ